jgi:hypothetical protein
MGRPRQPGGPHAEGRCVRAGSDSTAGEVKTLLPSPRASEVNPSAGLERHLPRPANGQGYGGHFHLGLLAAAIQKDARQAWHGRQATNPPWVFPFATAPACAGLGEGGGAPPPRRAGQGRSREPDRSRDIYTARTPSTRPGRRRAAPEGGGREPAGDEEQEPRRTTTGVNTYPAFVHLSTEPATTPSPPHREQPNRPLFSLLPLGLLPVLDSRRRDASPLFLA